MERTPLPALLEARRRLAGEMLAAAAVHSAICDELNELAATGETESERCALLRARKLGARRRHDDAERRLRRLSRHLRDYVPH